MHIVNEEKTTEFFQRKIEDSLNIGKTTPSIAPLAHCRPFREREFSFK